MLKKLEFNQRILRITTACQALAQTIFSALRCSQHAFFTETVIC